MFFFGDFFLGLFISGFSFNICLMKDFSQSFCLKLHTTPCSLELRKCIQRVLQLYPCAPRVIVYMRLPTGWRHFRVIWHVVEHS